MGILFLPFSFFQPQSGLWLVRGKSLHFVLPAGLRKGFFSRFIHNIVLEFKECWQIYLYDVIGEFVFISLFFQSLIWTILHICETKKNLSGSNLVKDRADEQWLIYLNPIFSDNWSTPTPVQTGFFLISFLKCIFLRDIPKMSKFIKSVTWDLVA